MNTPRPSAVHESVLLARTHHVTSNVKAPSEALFVLRGAKRLQSPARRHQTMRFSNRRQWVENTAAWVGQRADVPGGSGLPIRVAHA
ncbi:MAG: hypothetical protein IPK82_38355 [Polyangiaceae bacterium]|nr:hypothetical protein [Polyangiaceae bacterium]